MRTLYLPNGFEHSSATGRLLERSVQDTVRTDEKSRHYHAVRAFVNEIEWSLALASKLELRPWLADTQQAGSLVSGSTLPEAHFNELVFGVPDHWNPTLVRQVDFSSGFYTTTGDAVTSATVDRAVVHDGTILAQVGQQLFRISDNNPYGRVVTPESLGIMHPDDFILISLAEDRASAYQAGTAEDVEVAVQIEGVSLELGGPGRYTATVTYTGSLVIEDGDDISGTYQMTRPLNCQKAGVTVAYTNTDGVITVPSAEEGDTFLLFYEAQAVYTHVDSRQTLNEPVRLTGHRIDFIDAAEKMYRLITKDDVELLQHLDTLCNTHGMGRTVRVDRQGYVGEVHVGHTITMVLPTQYHTVVADANNITLVEYDTGRRVLHQEFPERTIVGLTWTEDGELGFIDATDDGFEVYALRDVRLKSAAGWTLP